MGVASISLPQKLGDGDILRDLTEGKELLDKHGSLWRFVSRLSRESGDKDLIMLFHAANGLHKNFYENELDKEAVELARQ